MDKLRDFLKSKWGAVIVAIVLSPMAFLGIESYFFATSNPNEVAKVGDKSIDRYSLQNAINARRKEILEQISDASLLNESVLNDQVLKGLIDRALLEQQAQKLGMTVSDATITRLLQQEPAFQENGQFSNDRFAFFLQQRGMNKNQLFAEFRNQLILTQLNASLVGTAIYPMSAINRLIDLQTESRNLWVQRLPWQNFADQVQISDQEIEDYYHQHQADLKSQAMVDLAYIQLSLQDIPEPQITDEDLQAQYALYKQENGSSDSREFSQILLTGSDAETRAKAAKDRLNKGEDFAKVAKELSDDPSSENGGAIGTLSFSLFGNDASKVEQALQSLKVGDISEPILTQFGYQIFQLTKQNEDKTPSFESLKDTLTTKAKDSKRQSTYADKITTINELATDGMSIEDIAKQENLQITTLKNYPKQNNQTALSQPAIINAAFDEFNIQDQAITAGINIKDSTLWIQPSNYRPVQTLTLEQAKDQITQILTQQKATDLALKAAQQIAQTIKTPEDLKNAQNFTALGNITRQIAHQLNNTLLSDKERSLAFSQPAPENGIITLTEATENGASILVAGPITTHQQAQLSETDKNQTALIIRDNLGQDQMQDYLEYLRMIYDIKINETQANTL